MKFSKLLIIAILLNACEYKSANKNYNEVIDIIVDLDNQSTLPASTFIDNFEYVLLEYTNQSLIGNIRKIELSDSSILIMDGNKKLLHFNIHGQFLNEIGSIGKGPGEYINILDFSIYDDKVWVFDGWNIKVYEKDGTFSGFLDLRNGELNKVSVRNMEVTKDGIYLYNGFEPIWNIKNNSLVYLADHLALKKKSHFDIYYNDKIHYANMMTSGSTMDKSREGILFFKFFNDTVYYLTGEGFTKKYAYDFGNKSLTINEREMLKVNNTSMYDIRDRIQGVYKSFLLQKSMLTCFFYNTRHLWHYKDFETGEDILSTEITDDLASYANFLHFFSSDGKLISYIPAEILHSESTQIDSKSILGKIKLQTTKYDNPILVICTLK